MGGFFLYKGLEESSLERVRQVFISRGFRSPEINICGEVVLWRYGKLAGPTVPPVRSSNGDRLFLSGSLTYRGMGGEAGAARLFSDVQRDAVDHDEMIGGFFAVFYEASTRSLRFVTDRFGLYHVFTDREGAFLTSSFLAAAAVDQSRTQVDADAVLENLCLGFVMAPRTLLREVERVGGKSRRKAARALGRFVEPGEMKLKSPRCLDVRECVSRQVSLLREAVAKLVGPGPGLPVAMGLSGGYDSRLLLLLAREAGASLVAHTHFKPAPDPDPVIACRVAKAAGVPLIMPRTPRPEEMDEGELARTVSQALLFFDGRSHSQMELLRQEYTPWYRRQVYGDAQTVLGGVGGEIYRNHDGSSSGGIRWNAWLGYHVVGYPVLSALRDGETRRRLLDAVHARVADRLRVDGSGRLSRLDRRRFYEEVWLADWHGLRNSVENQFAHYYSPFAHPPVMCASRSALGLLGSGGAFEAAMIRQLDREIAKIQSSYGYGFDRVPVGQRVRSQLWASLPTGLKLSAGMFRARRDGKKGNRLRWWETHYGFVGKAMRILKAMELPLDYGRYASNRTRLMLLLSVAFTVTALRQGPVPNRW